MPGRALVWSSELERWVAERLDVVHGRRTARRLSVAQVRLVAEHALSATEGFAVMTGGDVEDARQWTTVALAVVTADGVVVGLGAGRTQGVTPARAFSDLESWDAWNPVANVVRAEAWARRARDDRRLVPFQRAARSNDPAELLEAVLEAPDDEAPRQVYADWLLERGDARGELIAVQTELARGGLVDARRLELEAREVSLLSEHGARWLGRLASDAVRASFARGFLDALTVLDVSSLFDADETLRREPVRQLVFMTRQRLDVARVLTLPWVSRLRALEFSASHELRPALNLEGLSTLLGTRRLRGLTSLGFHGQALGDDGMALLARDGPHAFPSLVELAVTRDRVSAVGLRALARTRWFAGLERLSLDGNELGPDGAAELADVRFRKLERLSLGQNRLGSDGAAALAQSLGLETVERLWLHANGIGVTGGEALVQSPNLKRVSQLVLDGNPIGAKLRQALAGRR
ncbi:MAG: TIGR02996 domain-containing protein [Myxococcaceae bacterium]|nr:TIGR02996 domain-containing protein [Myxococcaceae bacterium]